MKQSILSIHKNRNQRVWNASELQIVKDIRNETEKANVDNISRTKAYLDFYHRNPEIVWALLASMVSRNAGWNMTDLQSTPYRKIMNNHFRMILFYTYERANWLIFLDAFPQLLLYERSKKFKKPLFHLLKYFSVSVFMEYQWLRFWTYGQERILCISQIINEQHVIEHPVIQHPFYHQTVFGHFLFRVQEKFHINAVIFPRMEGELYGFSVYRFAHVSKRIDIGKKLMWLLFDSPESQSIKQFAMHVEPTGSRYDYEQFYSKKGNHEDLPLRAIYREVRHKRTQSTDWFEGVMNPAWFHKPSIPPYIISTWYDRQKMKIKKLSQIWGKFMSE